MTQLRRDREALSNYFDQILEGLGKRASSFTDIDAVSHDGPTSRLLIQEFKEGSEPLSAAQHTVLREFARLPGCTVWVVRRVRPDVLAWTHVGTDTHDLISIGEYQIRFCQWWGTAPPGATRVHALREPGEEG